jgi:transposase
MPIKRAIKKYGKYNFTIKELEKCDESIINDRERYWIKQYDSYKSKNGYNCTEGGEGGNKPKLSKKEELEIVKLKEYKSLLELSKIYNVNKTTICNIVKRYGENTSNIRSLRYRMNEKDFINDVENGLTVKELMNRYNIKYCSVYNFIKRYNIKYNTSKSVRSLSNRNRGRKCTPNLQDDKL